MNKNNKKILSLLICITILIIIIFMKRSVAKYLNIKNIKQNFQLAQPIFQVEGNELTKINNINNIGYYEFSIKNYTETEISETGFLYYIEIISNTNEAISFELFNEEKQIKLENLKTEELSIAGNEKIEQKYKLKITYDSSKGNNGKDILGDVQIKIHSEQTKIG